MVRTPKVNGLFEAIPFLKRVLEEKEKGDSVKNHLYSSQVPFDSASSNELIQDLKDISELDWKIEYLPKKV
jgi:hypothetical protein